MQRSVSRTAATLVATVLACSIALGTASAAHATGKWLWRGFSSEQECNDERARLLLADDVTAVTDCSFRTEMGLWELHFLRA
ncbi:hypothetical protein [Agromyces silvae]|uniref:hypothetical protein n=1 Tax=Agromyces silvae TaxID=3388266 RepID=UPI00280BB0A2|nr:hypothetical protein [Agromyces protaetiae]